MKSVQEAVDVIVAGGGKFFSMGFDLPLLLGMALDSVHTGAGKKVFIRDAADWVRSSTPSLPRMLVT